MEAGEFEVAFKAELLRDSLPEGLALAATVFARELGFCVCLPDLVCAVGLYSSELTSESDAAESNVDARRTDESEPILFCFLLAGSLP